MAHGFVTSRPGARDGNTGVGVFSNTYDVAGKFTAPGTGTLNVSELGAWVASYVEQAQHMRVGLFEDDGANTCPAGQVSNGDTGEFDVTGQGSSTYYQAYGSVSSCTVTGGTAYWIAGMQDGNVNTYSSTAGGTGLYKSGCTYGTWPTDTAWHTHTDYNGDIDFWAVYAEAGGGGSAIPEDNRGVLRGEMRGINRGISRIN